jgi:AcrR family transcriptional regulator
VRAIALQAGVSSSAIYRYFPSLDALIRALNEFAVSELSATVEYGREQSGSMAGRSAAGHSIARRGFRRAR